MVKHNCRRGAAPPCTAALTAAGSAPARCTHPALPSKITHHARAHAYTSAHAHSTTDAPPALAGAAEEIGGGGSTDPARGGEPARVDERLALTPPPQARERGMVTWRRACRFWWRRRGRACPSPRAGPSPPRPTPAAARFPPHAPHHLLRRRATARGGRQAGARPGPAGPRGAGPRAARRA